MSEHALHSMIPAILFICCVDDGLHEPVIYILEDQYKVGCEFYGAQPTIGLTPITDRCFLSMSQAISVHKGAILYGTTGVGKTETVKVHFTLHIARIGSQCWQPGM